MKPEYQLFDQKTRHTDKHMKICACNVSKQTSIFPYKKVFKIQNGAETFQAKFFKIIKHKKEA